MRIAGKFPVHEIHGRDDRCKIGDRAWLFFCSFCGDVCTTVQEVERSMFENLKVFVCLFV